MIRIPSVDVMKSLCDCETCGLYKEASHPYIPGRWAKIKYLHTFQVKKVFL